MLNTAWAKHCNISCLVGPAASIGVEFVMYDSQSKIHFVTSDLCKSEVLILHSTPLDSIAATAATAATGTSGTAIIVV